MIIGMAKPICAKRHRHVIVFSQDAAKGHHKRDAAPLRMLSLMNVNYLYRPTCDRCDEIPYYSLTQAIKVVDFECILINAKQM